MNILRFFRFQYVKATQTWYSELVLEFARLLKDLNAVVIGVGHHNVLVRAQAKAVRRIELAFARTQLTELASVRKVLNVALSCVLIIIRLKTAL